MFHNVPPALFLCTKISVVTGSACAVPVTSSLESDLSVPSSDSTRVKLKTSLSRTVIKLSLSKVWNSQIYTLTVQRLIQGQFPKLNSLKLSLLQSKALKGSTANAVQIFHINGNHWIVATTVNGKTGKCVQVYDSAYSSFDHPSALFIKKIFSVAC